jgi:hypothetical protein
VAAKAVANAAAVAAAVARREAEAAAAHEINKRWFKRLPPSKGPPKYLVLGAAPDEERHGRTHYDDPNVWLLDNHTVAEGTNTSRYIKADYSAEKVNELRKIAQKFKGNFNQIAFDYSATCGVYGGSVQSLTDRFKSFYTMLKPNGIFILDDCGQNTRVALGNAGFSEVREIQVKSLGDETIISDLTDIKPEHQLLIAIKGGGFMLPATGGPEEWDAPAAGSNNEENALVGGGKRRSIRKSVRRRNLKLRKSRKNRV